MYRPSSGKLPRAVVERALALSLIDGVLYALMLGVGESYFVAAAVGLGSTPVELGLAITLPLQVGGLGSLLVLGLLRWRPRRRAVVTAAALGQSLLLFVSAWLMLSGAMTPLLLIGLLCAYHLCGQGAGVAWSSWYGDLVPPSIRGRYFGLRNALVHLATFLGLASSGVVLWWLEPAPGTDDGSAGAGFAVIFALAGLCRAGSATVLSRSPEPVFSGLPRPREALRFLATSRGRNAWRLIVGGALFHAAIYMAAPYFSKYMLDEMRLSYLEYMVALAASVAVKVVAMPLWGRAVDRSGARNAYTLALLFSALIPLPWLFLDDVTGAVAAHLWSGFAWGGYEVAVFAMLLDSTVRRTRIVAFTAQSLVHGTAQLGGSMAGAALLSNAGFPAPFVWSLAGRLAVAGVLPFFVRQLRPVTGPLPRRLVMRVVGFRHGPGLAHRPIPEPADIASHAARVPATEVERTMPR